MSDQKDQAPNSPSQSTDLSIKKTNLTETMPCFSIGDDILFSPITKNMKLSALKAKAYYNVLHAFIAESPAISTPRILLMKDLMKEWNINHKTHAAFEDQIKDDPMVKQLRNVSLASDDKRMQKPTAAEDWEITGVDGQPLKFRTKPNKDDMLKIRDQNLAPAKIQDGKVIPPAEIQTQEDKPSSTTDDSPVPSWGQVSPGSLVGRWINIRMPGEEDYVGFLVKQYDAETEMHELVPDLSKKDYVDPCNWIDIRHIPVEDIVWTEKNPDLPVWKCFLKPGETLLYETSTTRQKKQLKEVGKTSTGIPIIRKADKGKSIA